MSIDQEIYRAIRKDGHLGQEHLKLLARVGSPHVCCFCGHNVLAQQPQCGHRMEYLVGDAIYVDGIHIGSYVGAGGVAITNYVQGQRHTVLLSEMPDSWKPAPCACDHRVPVLETSMREYQTNHGVDLRVLQALNPQTVYHIHQKNRDGSHQRWRINGQIKTWKTRPGRFRVPVKHGLHSFDYLDHQCCKDFRTEAS